VSANTTQADLDKGLRLIDEELFPASTGEITKYGQHISDLSIIDAKNVLPTLNGYSSFFGVDTKIASVDLTANAQDIIGYRTLYGDAILLAFCDDGLYLRSLRGEDTAVVTDVPAAGNTPDHYTIDLPDGKGSWIKVMSPILGFLSPWKLWTYTIFQNHLYFYAKGFDRIFKLTSYEAEQVVIEQLSPTYIIGTGKAYEFIINSDDLSAPGASGLWKKLEVLFDGTIKRAQVLVPLNTATDTLIAPDKFVGGLESSGIAASYDLVSEVKTDIDATLTLAMTGLDLEIIHDAQVSEVGIAINEVGNNTVIDISGFKEYNPLNMQIKHKTVVGTPNGFILVFGFYTQITGALAGTTFSILLKVDVDANVTELLGPGVGRLDLPSIAYTPDLQTIVTTYQTDAPFDTVKLRYSTDYGDNWSYVVNSTLETDLTVSQKQRSLIYDGSKFWLLFYYALWNSSDGITWTNVSFSTSGLNPPAMLLDHTAFVYLNGIYYFSGTHVDTGDRATSTKFSLNGLDWTYLDDPLTANGVNQTRNSRIFLLNGTITILPQPSDEGYIYTHDGVSSTLDRVGAQDTTVFERYSTRAHDGYLVSYGNDATLGVGWYKSTDKGLTWSVMYLDATSETIEPYADRDSVNPRQVYNSVGTVLLGCNQEAGYNHVANDDWLWIGDDVDSWEQFVDLFATYRAQGIEGEIQFVIATPNLQLCGVSDTEETIHNLTLTASEDSNDLATELDAIFDLYCFSSTLVVTTPCTYENEFNLIFNLAMVDPAVIPSISLTKNTSTTWVETSSDSDDVQLAHMEGITSAKGRLVAWDIDNLIYWGSASDPVDFVPSAETRANQLSVTSILGKIIKCEGYANGFIIYSTGNVVKGTYVGGTHTYNFKPIKGINGVIDPRHIKATLADHYIWSNLGLIQLDPEQGELNLATPELTDWLSNYRYPITMNMAAGRFLIIYLKDRDLQFSNRYIRNSDINLDAPISHEATTEIEFNPARSGLNMYSTYSRALVFDTLLGKWGSLDLDHKLLFAIDAINQIGYKPEKDYSLVSANLHNDQKGLAILEPDGSISLADTYPDDSYLVFGKFASHRDRQTKLVETISEFVEYPDANIEIEKSVDGAKIDSIQTKSYTAKTDLRSVEDINMAGQWFNILLRGHYHLKRLLVKGYPYGRK